MFFDRLRRDPLQPSEFLAFNAAIYGDSLRFLPAYARRDTNKYAVRAQFAMTIGTISCGNHKKGRREDSRKGLALAAQRTHDCDKRAVSPTVKEALDRAAIEDARSASSLIQKLMTEWLKERKYLK